MSGRALILTYHAIDAGPAPLCIEPRLFRAHLDHIAESPIRVVTLERLALDLRAGRLTGRSVAITFDDGFQSVVDEAAPLLAERHLPATLFCVAGHVGGRNDWATQPATTPLRPLAGVSALRELARTGFEIGSHGMEHVPLSHANEVALEREVVESRRSLERLIGSPVRWFAHPYGVPPGPGGRRLVELNYAGACLGGPAPVRSGADMLSLPRVDAHYLRRPGLLRRALEGLDPYLHVRRAGALVRRAVHSDYRVRGR